MVRSPRKGTMKGNDDGDAMIDVPLREQGASSGPRDVRDRGLRGVDIINYINKL